MLIIWVAFLLTCIYGIRVSKGYSDYLNKNQTNSIKGMFAGIIMFSHFLQYITLSDSLMDSIFSSSVRSIGQLMVVMFFFYSGYGIVISASRKPGYFDSFFKHRILHTLFYFDLAVVMYLVYYLFFGKIFPFKRIILSFIGWNSVGNSNWFVFAIICSYLITLAAARLQDGKINKKSLAVITIGCLLYMLILRVFKESWWYNTIMTFPAGLFCGYYKDRIDHLIKRYYWLALSIILLLFAFLRRYSESVFVYEVYAVFFAILIILITYRVKISNLFLNFMGKYAFDIYLLQRIPALLFQNSISNNVIYFIAFFVGTIICAVLFHELCKRTLAFL